MADCLFCDREQHKILAETPLLYIRLDNFPAAPGHVEVVPWRHVGSYFDLTGPEAEQLHPMLALARLLAGRLLPGMDADHIARQALDDPQEPRRGPQARPPGGRRCLTP